MDYSSCFCKPILANHFYVSEGILLLRKSLTLLISPPPDFINVKFVGFSHCPRAPFFKNQATGTYSLTSRMALPSLPISSKENSGKCVSVPKLLE